MTRPFRTILALAAVGLSAFAVSASPAVAAKPACWKVVINDWYDGQITGKYALHCYREALAHLGSDTKGYTSAYDDINRALQQRIAEIAAAKKLASKPKPKKTKPAVVVPPAKSSGGNGPSGGSSGSPSPSGSSNSSNSAPPSANSGSSDPSGSAGPSGSQSPPAPGAVQRNHVRTDRHSAQNQSPSRSTATPKPASPAPSTTTPANTKGRDVNGAGPVQSAIKKLGPSDATSVPIPLIVLAGLAVLLMVVGAASLIAKRAQARRAAPVPVRSRPSQQSR
jgi:cobalamin biosynthesis Mg chelatase CobN